MKFESEEWTDVEIGDNKRGRGRIAPHSVVMDIICEKNGGRSGEGIVGVDCPNCSMNFADIHKTTLVCRNCSFQVDIGKQGRIE